MYNLKPLGYDKETGLYKMEVCGETKDLSACAVISMIETNIMTIIDKSLDGTDGLYNYGYIHSLLEDIDDHYRHMEFMGEKE